MKTHQPTPQKLRDARKRGQLPRSKLFSASSATLGGLAGMLVFSRETWARLAEWSTRLLSLEAVSPTDALFQGLGVLGRGAAPALAGALLGALVSGVVTAGGVELDASRVAPKLERLDLAQGLKKLFSVRQLVEVFKGLLVAGVVGWILWSGTSAAAPVALKSVLQDGGPALGALLELLSPLVLRAAVVLLALGIGDWALARRRHRQDLMMSHQEVKQEHKSSEGDPHHKAKRRALHKQLAQGGAARGVQKATAIVVNPTHIAVALRYAESECDAPYIVAKGREEDALKIRKQANSLGIPIIRDVPLARALVHFDVGEEVPEELYRAAAAVLKVAQEQTEEETVHPEEETP